VKILFLTNYYPPHEVGGYEQLCRDVAQRLDGRGHTVTVLTCDRGVAQNENADEPGIYRQLRISPKPNTRLGIASQFFLTRQQAEAHNRHVFHYTVQRFHPDVIFIWNLQGLPQELAVDAEAQPGTAVAYWLAGYTPAEPDLFWRYWAQPPGKRSSLRGMKQLVSRIALAQMRREGKPARPRMRHVAVVSDYMRHKGWADDTLPSHAEVIYNGVETDQFFRPAPPPDSPPPVNLLVAGRVSADKGVHVAVEAAGKLAQARSGRDFRLIIAGSGPGDYLAHLQQLAASQQIGDLISFTSWLPREHMPQIMQACHILLLTSIYPEAFSRVVLEGMAAGLAVIGTLTGGTGELLQDGVNGLACATEDSTDLARQIGRLLDHPQLRYCLARRGQEMVLAKYTLDHMVERVESLLQRAIAEQVGLSG